MSIITGNSVIKRPKVLIATGIFPPQIGGPATYSKLLLEELPSRGVQIKVQSFGWVIKYPKVIRHIVYFLKLFFSAFGCSIIYAQDPVSVGLPGLVAARLLGKKFYLKIVGDYAWEQGSQRSGVTDLLDQFSTEYNKYPFFVRILKRIEFFVADSADKIIVPSNYLKKIVMNWGIKGEKIQVIYNAFHAPNFNGEREEMRKKFNIDHPMIITVGRLVPWKGFDTLIALMPEIAMQIKRAKLYIVGDGPDKDYLKECVKKAKAQDCVVLTGKMMQSDLFEYIKASDLFVLNTSYEGLSHQLLEVLYLEVPILCSDAGGNIEVIDHDKNGALFTYNDKEAIRNWMIKLLSDRELASRYVERGKEKLDFFGEERMLREITEVLKA
jgi:glycosyltransferase involved in cell wall biosynthesis